MGRNRGPNPLIPGWADVMTLRWMSAGVSEPRAGPTPTQVDHEVDVDLDVLYSSCLTELVARPEPSRTVGRPILDLLTRQGRNWVSCKLEDHALGLLLAARYAATRSVLRVHFASAAGAGALVYYYWTISYT